MGNRPIDIAASTAHSQAAEFAALANVSSQPKDTTELENALRAAIAKQADLTAELEAEKEAHAKTQAALTAATVTPAA